MMHGKSYLPSHKVLFWGAIWPFARAYEMAYVIGFQIWLQGSCAGAGGRLMVGEDIAPYQA